MLVFAASKRRPKDGGRAPLEIWALAVVFTALGAAVRLPETLAPRTACLAPSAREVVTEAMVTWGRECDSGRGATRRRAFSQTPACHWRFSAIYRKSARRARLLADRRSRRVFTGRVDF